MSAITTRMPDHLDLPDSDGSIVENDQEAAQSELLTQSILPVLEEKHPDGTFTYGTDVGIYWKRADPPLEGAKSPDWWYVPGVPRMLKGHIRRSYVMWQELVPPMIILEYASGDGSEERDQTPEKGKFWVYERVIGPAYYGIFEPFRGGVLEVYRRERERFVRMEPNLRNRFEIPELGVELGTWTGTFRGLTGTWLRWFEPGGRMLPSDNERAEILRREKDVEKQRAEAEHNRAEAERLRAAAESERANRLAERLRQLGMDPDAG